jgi:hypothetical protein
MVAGAEAGLVPGSGIWNPVTAPDGSDIQVRTIPYSWRNIEAYAGADWKFAKHDTVGLTYTFDHYDPAHREVSYADDNSLKLNWTDKNLSWLTFRFNYTYLKPARPNKLAEREKLLAPLQAVIGVVERRQTMPILLTEYYKRYIVIRNHH